MLTANRPVFSTPHCRKKKTQIQTPTHKFLIDTLALSVTYLLTFPSVRQTDSSEHVIYNTWHKGGMTGVQLTASTFDTLTK
jgi:hypothetical protein